MSQVIQPAQKQDHQPGIEAEMSPTPASNMVGYTGSEKLKGQTALVTGGDSGIGRAVAIAYAKEGANVAIIYLSEDEDAANTQEAVKVAGTDCLLIKGDIGDEGFCRSAVQTTLEKFGRLDVLVNNAAEQYPQESINDISAEQLEKTFRTNIFSMFFMVKAALPHLKKNGGRIVNTTSITAYRGSPKLLDYSATKGAIVAFTRSLSQLLLKDGIRVNAVAPGPVWTPLIPASFPPDKVAQFGSDVPMGRPAQPDEIAPAFVFLASKDSSYIAGQVIHANGGVVING